MRRWILSRICEAVESRFVLHWPSLATGRANPSCSEAWSIKAAKGEMYVGTDGRIQFTWIAQPGSSTMDRGERPTPRSNVRRPSGAFNPRRFTCRTTYHRQKVSLRPQYPGLAQGDDPRTSAVRRLGDRTRGTD